jgi:hypothetical protein
MSNSTFQWEVAGVLLLVAAVFSVISMSLVWVERRESSWPARLVVGAGHLAVLSDRIAGLARRANRHPIKLQRNK